MRVFTSVEGGEAGQEFEDLYRTHRKRVVQMAWLLTRDAAAAEDMAHDAFAALFRVFDSVQHPAAYLRRSVINRVSGSNEVVIAYDALGTETGRFDEEAPSARPFPPFADLSNADFTLLGGLTRDEMTKCLLGDGGTISGGVATFPDDVDQIAVWTQCVTTVQQVVADAVKAINPRFYDPATERPETVVATRTDENLTHDEVAALLGDLLPDLPGGCDGQQDVAGLLVAVAPRADGNNLALVAAGTPVGTLASTILILDSEGTLLGSSGGCGGPPQATWAGAATDQADGQANGIIDVYGRTVPTATQARVTFTSGAVVILDVQQDGYFLGSLDDHVGDFDEVKTVEPVF